MIQHNQILIDNDLYSNKQFHQKQLMLVVLVAVHLFDFQQDLFDRFFAIEPIQFNFMQRRENNNVYIY
jgi:hypothetical protein